MKMHAVRLVGAIAFLLGALLFAETPDPSWQSGRVISAAVSGHGGRTGRTSGESDMWWNYCIATADRSYSVVSRQGPEKSGLLTDRLIRFSEKRNQLFTVNASGKSIALKIVRRNKAGKCSF